MTAWTGERIAELRGLAEQAYKPEVGAAVPLKDALTPDAVLSLLDELEGCKLERSELLAQLTDYAGELESTRAALAEAVTTIHDLRAREVPR